MFFLEPELRNLIFFWQLVYGTENFGLFVNRHFERLRRQKLLNEKKSFRYFDDVAADDTN